MKQARIEAGFVVEVAPKEARFEPGLFVECPDKVEVGWNYARGRFSPPSLQQVRTKAEYAIEERSAEQQQETCGFELTPMSSARIGEAEKWLAGERDGDFPFLDARVGVTAKTRDEAAQQIRARHCEYCKAAAAIERKRLEMRKAVAAAPTIAKIDEILREFSGGGINENPG